MREKKVEIRCTPEEKEDWVEQAKPYSLSEYIRQLLIKDKAYREGERAWTSPR